jgi:hypothetical protein
LGRCRHRVTFALRDEGIGDAGSIEDVVRELDRDGNVLNAKELVEVIRAVPARSKATEAERFKQLHELASPAPVRKKNKIGYYSDRPSR